MTQLSKDLLALAGMIALVLFTSQTGEEKFWPLMLSVVVIIAYVAAVFFLGMT